MEPHDTHPNFPGFKGHLFNFRNGKTVTVNNIVQKGSRHPDNPFHPFVINFAVLNKIGKVQ